MNGMRLVKFYDDIMYDVDPTGKSEEEVAAEQAIWIPENQHTIKRNNDSWIWNGTAFEEPTEEYLIEKEKRKQERQAKYELETKRHYLALGQFVVKFEHLMENIETLAERLLVENGLSHDFSIVFTKNNGASGLIDLTERIIHRTPLLGIYPDTQDLFLQVLALVKKVNEERNDIIHGRLYVGYVSDDEISFSSFSGYRYKIDPAENVMKTFSYTVEDINCLTMRCLAFEDCFSNLAHILLHLRNPAFLGIPEFIESSQKAIAVSLTKKDFWKQPNLQRENTAKSLLPKLQKFIDAYPDEGKMFRQEWKPFTI